MALTGKGKSPFRSAWITKYKALRGSLTPVSGAARPDCDASATSFVADLLDYIGPTQILSAPIISNTNGFFTQTLANTQKLTPIPISLDTISGQGFFGQNSYKGGVGSSNFNLSNDPTKYVDGPFANTYGRRIIESGGGTAQHYASFYEATFRKTGGWVWTGYIRANGFSTVEVVAQPSQPVGVLFNFSTGTASITQNVWGGQVFYSMTSVGNGYYRCVIGITSTSISNGLEWKIGVPDTTSSTAFSSTNSVDLYGVQMTVGTSDPGTYPSGVYVTTGEVSLGASLLSNTSSFYTPTVSDAGLDGNATGTTLTATSSLLDGTAYVDASTSGTTLTATSSLIAASAFGAASASGLVLTATSSLIAPTASADASTSGTTLTATTSVIAGAATAGATASGIVLTATASLIAGTASAGINGTASGVTLTATASLIAATATGDALTAGYTFTGFLAASLLPGTASGAASTSGTTLTATSSFVAATATGGATGTGATITAVSSLIAATATGSAAATGVTITNTASLIAGSAFGAATGSGATLTGTASLIAASASGTANATGVTLAATSSLIPGTATGAISATASGVTLTATASVAAAATATGTASQTGSTVTATVTFIPGTATAGGNATVPGQTLTATTSVVAGSGRGDATAFGATITTTGAATLIPGTASGTASTSGAVLVASTELVPGGASVPSASKFIPISGPHYAREYEPKRISAAADGVTLVARASIVPGIATGTASTPGARLGWVAEILAGAPGADGFVAGPIIRADGLYIRPTGMSVEEYRRRIELEDMVIAMMMSTAKFG